MVQQTVLKHDDWWRLVEQAAKPSHINWEKQKFELKIDFDKKALEKIGKDPLLQQKCWDPATSLWPKMIKDLAGVTKKHDATIAKAWAKLEGDLDMNAFVATAGKAKAAFGKDCEATVASYKKAMETGVQKGWADYCKLKQDVKGFKIKIIVDNVLRVASIGINTAKLAISGGTSILTYQSLIKDVVKISVDVFRMFRELEKLQNDIQGELDSLKKSMTTTAGKGAELTATFISAFVGHTVIPTVNNTEKMLKAHIGKTDMADKSMHTLSKKLNEALKKQNELDKELPNALKGDLNKLADQVVKLLAELEKEHKKVKNARVFHAQANKGLGDLRAVDDRKKFDKGVKIIETLWDAGKATNSILSGSWTEANKLATNISGSATTLGKNAERHFKSISDGLKKVA